MVKKIKWVGTLSTTERNNIGLIQVRQNNVNSEVLGFNIIDGSGEPYDLKNRKVLFCTYFDKFAPVEQYAEVIENGKIIYTMNEHDMQKPVRINFAYFKILDEKDNLVDTTQNFSYDIMPSIESKCMNSEPYIIRLEEVLDAFNSIRDDAMKEMQRIIIKFNEQVIQQQQDFELWFNSIREILESVDPGGILLSEIVGARVDDEGNVYSSLKERLNDAASNRYEVDLEIDVGGNVKEFFKAELQKIKSKLNLNNFNLLNLTDSHFTQNEKELGKIGKYSLNHTNNALFFSDICDVIYFGGDNCHSSYKNKQDALRDNKTFALKVFDTPVNKSDIFITLGNHDDGSDQYWLTRQGSSLSPEKIIQESEFKVIYRTHELLCDEKREDGSIYFYKDYPEKKIRLISLNTSDLDDSLTNSEGGIKYNRWHTMSYRQKQLEWLANVALRNIPDGFHVLFIGHYPINYSGEPGFPKTITEINVDEEVYVNHDVFWDIVVAFKEGSFMTRKNSLEDFEIDLKVDFSEQGPQVVAGVISGHTHIEKDYELNGIGIHHCLNSFGKRTRETDPLREINTLSEDALSIISVNNEKRTLDIIGFGAASNRSFEY